MGNENCAGCCHGVLGCRKLCGVKTKLIRQMTDQALPEDGKPSAHMDPTLFGHDREAITYIGQLYMQYVYGKTTFKLGRQELKTPLEDMDDARMLPNLF
ncbi:MAG: hypothetical protein ACUVQ6_01395 [Dissulfurimicrobium sp.]